MPERPYTYYDFTLSICPECLRRVDAKIVFEGSNVFMMKNCAEHGFSKVLIATDIEYYKKHPQLQQSKRSAFEVQHDYNLWLPIRLWFMCRP